MIFRTLCRTSMAESKTLYPAVGSYGPCAVKGLKVGETKKWCTCGLSSKKQPWCDGSHKGTGFKSMKFTVEKEQEVYYICNCKQTKTPPYCDGSHTSAPEVVEKRKNACAKKDGHVKDCKLCTNCGWVPDF
ncbi:CDGSH iron-sulfur domain-containing protein 3, mitochondrial-like isoform X2 [Dreissena polymorpha]|nr:CDGSH iron-sulfur domain-containing protein 3, mitochondrial-like isoform X2 [Dreissena polymorpha]